MAVLIDVYAALLTEAPYADVVGKSPRWMVVRSFNKALAPDLRVAVVVGDAQTISRMLEQQWLSDGWISPHLQRVAAMAIAAAGIRRTLKRGLVLRRSP